MICLSVAEALVLLVDVFPIAFELCYCLRVVMGDWWL